MSNEEIKNPAQPAAEKPAEEKPVADKPAAESKPVADKPATESKPVADKPAAESKPAADKPATESKPAESKSLEAKLAEVVDSDGDEKTKVDAQELKAAKAAKKAEAQAKAQAKKAATAPPAGKKGKGGGKKKGKDGKKGKKKAKAVPFVKRTEAPRLKQKWQNEVVPSMMKEFGYTTPMAVPKLVKITLNMGLGEALQNAKLLDAAMEELGVIAGQHPVITQARKSIATFKLRQGQKIGCMVTLRNERMYEFLDRLVTFALPRTRDFKGISPKSFDGRGNFSLGILEQIVFPEIDYDKIEKIMGLNISVVTTARTDEEGRVLLKHFGMPFRT